MLIPGVLAVAATTVTVIAAVIAAIAAVVSAVLSGVNIRSAERKKWQREQRLPMYARFLNLTRIAADTAESTRISWEIYDLDGRRSDPRASEIRAAFYRAHEDLERAAAELDLVASDRVTRAVRKVEEASRKVTAFSGSHPSLGTIEKKDYEGAIDALLSAEQEYVRVVRRDLGTKD